MGLFSKLNPISGVKESIDNLVDNASKLADQAILDQDAWNELRFRLYELATTIQAEAHLAELSTKTVPWVDALHKMGRQILAGLAIVAVIAIKYSGHDLSPEEVALIGGPSLGYILAKGKGK